MSARLCCRTGAAQIKARALVRVLAADDSGVLGLSWFNTPYVADKLIIGQTYYFREAASAAP